MKVIPSESDKGRFVIADDSGKVVDDAQGWGYTSFGNATRAMWYKFQGGKKKRKKRFNWWNRHRDLAEHITEIYRSCFKEIGNGEITDTDIFNDAKKFAVENGIGEFDRQKFDLFIKDKMEI